MTTQTSFLQVGTCGALSPTECGAKRAILCECGDPEGHEGPHHCKRCQTRWSGSGDWRKDLAK